MTSKDFLDQIIFGESFPRKTISPKRRMSKKQFKTLCDYNTLPVKTPLNIDDFEFKFKPGFLDKLARLYDKVKKDGSIYQIANSTATGVVSPKLFLRDILTEYTVKNIFDKHTQNLLIHIINKIMKSMYDQFYAKTKIKLYFVYRGGNILKMYKKTFEDILPGVSRKVFKEEFDDFFRNSDLDFYTIIEDANKLSKFEIYAINDYIQMMCYYGLYVARIFIMNNFGLFEYCQMNQIKIDEDFEMLLNEMEIDKKESEFDEVRKTKFIGLGFGDYLFMKNGMNIDNILNMRESKILKSFVPSFGETGDEDVIEKYKKIRISGRADLNITPKYDVTDINNINYKQTNLFQFDYAKMTNELVNKNKILPYYITNNNEIYNKEEYIDFSLVRMMINFTVVYERDGKYGLTNAPSELYDLSIGHPEDKMYQVYIPENIVPFEFVYGVEDENMLTDTIYIPSIQTTILDLVFILFEYRDFPWEDPKYNKRLYRLLVLIFVVEMSKNNLTQMEKILNSKKQRQYKDEYDNTFETLLFRNKEVISKIKTDQDKKSYQEYSKRYKHIVDKLKNVLKRLRQFDNSSKKVEKEEIYDFVGK
jgi:hypothetical protein